MWGYIIGHLVGDFLIQSDWEANNKTWDNRKWFGLPVAALHSSYIAGLIWFFCWLGGQSISVIQVLAVFITHTIQDFTRFPFKIMALRGQFEGVKFKRWVQCVDNESGFVNVVNMKNPGTLEPKKIEVKQVPEHAYLWACFVIDQVWHFATYYVIFLL